MAATPDGPPSMREAGLGPMVLAVGAVSGLLMALSVGGLSLLNDGGIEIADSDLAEAAIGQPSTDTDSTSSLDRQPTTTVPSAPTPTSLPVVPPASSDSDLELWSAATSAPTADEVLLRTSGVFASPNVDARLASYLIHDGMVVTSAAAVSGRDTIWLRVAGRWSTASVAMADPYTDVAVLQTDEPLPEDLLSSTISIAEPEPGSKISVGLGASAEQTAGEAVRSGVVAALNQPVKTSLNRNCYDAFTTSLRSAATAPGSAIVDGDGAVMGMVISTFEPTAAALPITTVIAVARSMMDTGSPAAVWLGIEAGPDSEGRTRVIDVVIPGPAAEALMADDVIVSIDGQVVENPDHLVHLVRGIGTDVEAEVIIERDGTTESVSLRPAPVTAKR